MAYQNNYRAILVYIFFIIIGGLNITFISLWIGTAGGFQHPHVTNDKSCYNLLEHDNLPYLDEKVMKGANNIFFVETSCRGILDSIEACAVESAVRANSDWLVHVVFSGPVSKENLNKGIIAALRSLPVNIVRVELNKTLQGTPLERIVTQNLLHATGVTVAHVSDVLRYYLLWKYGGIYMDLDFVVLKPFHSLAKDFAATENNIVISSGAIGISNSYIGNKIASALVEELGKSFENRTRSWSGSGPALLTALMMKICNTDDVSMMSVQQCQGFKIYSFKVFYPISPNNYTAIYKQGDINLKDSYAIHVWNKLISKYQRIVPKNSLYDKLSKEYCPMVHDYFLDKGV